MTAVADPDTNGASIEGGGLADLSLLTSCKRAGTDGCEEKGEVIEALLASGIIAPEPTSTDELTAPATAVVGAAEDDVRQDVPASVSTAEAVLQGAVQAEETVTDCSAPQAPVDSDRKPSPASDSPQAPLDSARERTPSAAVTSSGGQATVGKGVKRVSLVARQAKAAINLRSKAGSGEVADFKLGGDPAARKPSERAGLATKAFGGTSAATVKRVSLVARQNAAGAGLRSSTSGNDRGSNGGGFTPTSGLPARQVKAADARAEGVASKRVSLVSRQKAAGTRLRRSTTGSDGGAENVGAKPASLRQPNPAMNAVGAAGGVASKRVSLVSRQKGSGASLRSSTSGGHNADENAATTMPSAGAYSARTAKTAAKPVEGGATPQRLSLVARQKSVGAGLRSSTSGRDKVGENAATTTPAAGAHSRTAKTAPKPVEGGVTPKRLSLVARQKSVGAGLRSITSGGGRGGLNGGVAPSRRTLPSPPETATRSSGSTKQNIILLTASKTTVEETGPSGNDSTAGTVNGGTAPRTASESKSAATTAAGLRPTNDETTRLVVDGGDASRKTSDLTTTAATATEGTGPPDDDGVKNAVDAADTPQMASESTAAANPAANTAPITPATTVETTAGTAA